MSHQRRTSELASSQVPLGHEDSEATSVLSNDKVSSGVDSEQKIGHGTTAKNRQRINSHSREPKARPSSCYDEGDRHEFSRAGSMSGARPPSIVEVQKEPTLMSVSSNVQPLRSPKRRVQRKFQDTDGSASGACTVTENQNKVEPCHASPRRHPRHDSSSSAESILLCPSVESSLSSYDAEPDFNSPEQIRPESESSQCSAA